MFVVTTLKLAFVLVVLAYCLEFLTVCLDPFCSFKTRGYMGESFVKLVKCSSK